LRLVLRVARCVVRHMDMDMGMGCMCIHQKQVKGGAMQEEVTCKY